MAQEFWPLARRDEGAEPKHSVTETRRRREPGCTGDNQRRQRPKEQARLLPLFISSDLRVRFAGVFPLEVVIFDRCIHRSPEHRNQLRVHKCVVISNIQGLHGRKGIQMVEGDLDASGILALHDQNQIRPEQVGVGDFASACFAQPGGPHGHSAVVREDFCGRGASSFVFAADKENFNGSGHCAVGISAGGLQRELNHGRESNQGRPDIFLASAKLDSVFSRRARYPSRNGSFFHEWIFSGCSSREKMARAIFSRGTDFSPKPSG